FARVFRNRERGALHHPEFTMVEWYRAHEPYETLMDDCAGLLAEAARAAGAVQLVHRGKAVDPFAAAERLTVAEAFSRHAGVDLLATVRNGKGDRAALAAKATKAGILIADNDNWADIFSRILVERVDPHLGVGRATILYEYPLPLAALARAKPGSDKVAERFELYACGVELANAFGELRNTAEQRARFEAAMTEQEGLYSEVYPIAEDFLAALAGMPPASGIALGLDRLVMLATGAQQIDQVIWAPTVEIKKGRGTMTALSTCAQISEHGYVPSERRQAIEKVTARYAVALPESLADLIDRSHPDDPIASQVVPDVEERDHRAAELVDPIGDDVHSPVEGIVHRYPDRVLLKLTHICAVYCRFCFRR